MCGASPEKIGQEMWSAIPTLRALIKMTTSGRYRFPTIDCDEAQFREMKAAEASMRDEVSTSNHDRLLSMDDRDLSGALSCFAIRNLE